MGKMISEATRAAARYSGCRGLDGACVHSKCDIMEMVGIRYDLARSYTAQSESTDFFARDL